MLSLNFSSFITPSFPFLEFFIDSIPLNNPADIRVFTILQPKSSKSLMALSFYTSFNDILN